MLADIRADSPILPELDRTKTLVEPELTRDHTILVVDDDPNLLRMVRRAFAFAGCTVHAVEDGQQALAFLREREPDLLVLDVMLADSLDGFEVVRRMRAGGCDVPVLMLTARGDLADRLEGFRSGVDDYLSKPFALEELLARAAALLRRGRRAQASGHQERVRYADIEVDPSTREAWRAGRPLDLTAREFDLLVLFLRNPRHVLTRDQVFRAIWRSDFLGSSNIIDANVYCLRTKLESNGLPRVIQTVRGVGYALRASE